LLMAARAINDVFNVSKAPPRAHPGSTGFADLIAVLRRIQKAGAIGMRTEKRGTSQVSLVSFRSTAGGAAESDVRYVKQLLRLNPEKQEYLLASGSFRRDADEIVLLTRSIQEIMLELLLGVDVPNQDLAEGRATRRAADFRWWASHAAAAQSAPGRTGRLMLSPLCATGVSGFGSTIEIWTPSACSCSYECSPPSPKPAWYRRQQLLR
jgi:hypothetical protein